MVSGGPAMAGGGGQIQVVPVRGELDLTLADSLAARGYAAIGRQARAAVTPVLGDAHRLNQPDPERSDPVTGRSEPRWRHDDERH